MKNKKGEIATLLTLGLVIVGAVITLASSFFVSNKKTNLASNSKAAGSCAQGTDTTGAISSTCSTICGSYDNYYSNSQWDDGSERHCCCGRAGGGGGDYPEDDSCWIIKCVDNKSQYLQYSDSLSRYDMPLSSCKGGSPYGGGGQMAIGIENRDSLLATLSCSGNEETFTPPTSVPAPTIGDGSIQSQAPREGCTRIAVKGKITSQQQNSCTSQNSQEVEYSGGKYWCCPPEVGGAGGGGGNIVKTPTPTRASISDPKEPVLTMTPKPTKTPTPTPTIDISNVDYKSLGNLTVILNLGNNSYVKTGDRFILNIPEYAPMVQTEGSISNSTVTFSVNNMARYTSGFGGGTNQKSYTLNIIYNGNSIISEKITFGPTEINKTVSYSYNLDNLHPSIDFIITNNSCEAGFVITKNSLYISVAGAFNFPSENITVNQGKTVTETFNLPSDQSLLINNNTASIQAFCNTNSGSKSLRLNNLPITEDANGNFKIYISD